MPKLVSGEVQKIFANSGMTYALNRSNADGSTTYVQVNASDVVEYVNDLEFKLVKLATKVADSV